ncbi:MAG TPA: hypothetical protein VMQ17_16640 [Candidatus Sulfotelmatobacter sp.]|nr:hypothetical protein [Candidatus Sulfotelmatobacter sp.]
MATNATRTQPTGSGNKSLAALAQDTGARHMDPSHAHGSAEDAAAKPAGYGLPCAKCRLYYSADLDICPTCHHHERVSPVVPKMPPKLTHAVPDPVPDSALVEQEREEFLRQFKSQLMEAHSQVMSTAGSICALGEHRAGDDAGAVVCKACYDRLQERLDLHEAALHVDLKEAAQIIYDAVWADPSDPNKTYENAANALLSEIRKRAGVSALMGPFQPLSD